MSSTVAGMSRSKSALPQVGMLMVSDFGLWLLLIVPAWLLGGSNGAVGLTISAVLCFVPGCLALLWKCYFCPSHDVFFLVSTGLRFGILVLSALVAKLARPEFGLCEFYIWLIVFYLFALAIETWLALRG